MATQRNFSPCTHRLLGVSENDTSFIIAINNSSNNYNRHHTINSTNIQGITLLQEPSESMDFKLTVRNGYYNYSGFQFDLDITFANYVHEISQDYAYIVQIQALKKDNDHRNIHVNLFCHDEIRRTNKISLKNTESLTVEPTDVIHYCCCIRRYNSVKSTISHLSSSHVNDIMTKMLEDGIYSDVSLVVGEKTFKAHKQILSMQSDVFKAMFSHDMAENKSGILKIDGFDANVIEDMLLYIYTGTTKKLPKISGRLFEAADRYQIHGLKIKCEEYFIFYLNCTSVIYVLHLARTYGLKKLEDAAMSFVRNHEGEMVKELSYREFLCRDLSVSTVVPILLLSAKYGLTDVQTKAFKFVKNNNQSLMQKKEFLNLFITNGGLMQKLYVYIHS